MTLTSHQRRTILTRIADDAALWALCWPYTDAYGVPGFVPPQGYDWSGFRDSSDGAVTQMQRAIANVDIAAFIATLSRSERTYAAAFAHWLTTTGAATAEAEAESRRRPTSERRAAIIRRSIVHLASKGMK